MRGLPIAVAATLFAVSCGSSGPSGGQSTTELRVYAASSLTAAFAQIGSDFEELHPGVDMSFTFGSSTDLADRIAGGETAAVFASASTGAMDTVATGPGVTDRADLATNHLAIITPPDNPLNVVSLDSLTSPMSLVIGAEGTPIGDYTRQMLAAQGLEHAVLTNVISNESDDASIVAKVEGGDVDAGIVYSSDIPITAGKVHVIEIPPRINITAIYQVAAVQGAEPAAEASAFVAYVLGKHGQVVLDSHGFEPPPG